MGKEIKQIRRLIALFMAGLIMSGATALPLATGGRMLLDLICSLGFQGRLADWFSWIVTGLEYNGLHYPFMAYGTDWLAFGHFVIAFFFIGPYRDPTRNKWVIQMGILACLAVIPFAFVAGFARGIPIAWRCIDCSFGVVGAWVLCRAMMLLNKAEQSSIETTREVDLIKSRTR